MIRQWPKKERAGWPPRGGAQAALKAQVELLGPGTSDLFLWLPWPPTVNTYWRHIVVGNKARVVISERGRNYRQEVIRAVVNQTNAGRRRVEGRIAVDILAYPPDKRQRDLDNLPKALLDALQAAGTFENDFDIEDLRIRRVLDHDKRGTVEVSITRIAT